MDDEMLMKPQIEFRESRSSSTSSGSSVTSLSSSSGVSSLGSSSSGGGGGIHYYSQFEQSVLRSYGVQSGVNPALLAAASIAAAATVSGRESSPELQSNRSPSPPELTFTISHHPQQQQHQEMLNGGRLTPTESMTQEMQQQPIDMMIQQQQQQQPPMAHQQHLQQQQQLSPVNSNAFAYEPLSIMKHHGYFAPASQVTEFRSSSDIVRQVEAAIAGTENLLTPPRSSPESPDRSSSPESDSAVLMANRDNNTLPPRKRRLYFKDQPGHQGGHHLHQQQQGEHPAAPAEVPVVRMSSVIQFAKAS